MAAARPLHLDDILGTHRQVYVRNNKAGIVAMTLHEANGRPVSVALPKTRHPICVSSKATPYAMQNSTALRAAISNEHLTLLDPDSAEAELAKPGVMDAVKAAEKRMGYTSDDVMKNRDQRGSHIETLVELGATADPHSEIGSAPSDVLAAVEGRSTSIEATMNATEVQTRVSIIVELVVAGEKDVKEAKTELQNMQEDLSLEDLDFIVQHVPAGVLREWAREKLAERRGTQE